MAAPERFSAAHPGDPQPGDLIEIFRPAYQHWALYLGDGYIINVAPVGKAGTARKSAVLGCLGVTGALPPSRDRGPHGLSSPGSSVMEVGKRARKGYCPVLIY